MNRRLTGSERVAFDHVRPSTIDKTTIRSLPWLPGMFKGVTLGSNVFLTTDEPSDGTSTLIAHELVHVEQYDDHGSVRFLVTYLRDFLKGLVAHRSWMVAYRGITAEVEARQVTQ
ncbi:MAG: eCIS core domain-containing protein, partial [Acidimicrobiales bacterium]